MNNNFIKTNKAKELVINWHITEVCNFDCGYCFAKWGKPNELHRVSSEVEKLLEELANYFICGNPPLKRSLGYKSVRLNLAGGEPMLLGKAFNDILSLAKKKGFKTSIITNGSYLLKKGFEIPPNSLDMIGVSFDSQSEIIRTKIGRLDRKGNSFCAEQLSAAFEMLSKTQEGLITKVNTVVNALNVREDFSSIISKIKPDKWKVLQVMPYGTDELLISNREFQDFIVRHDNKGLPISPESNHAMTESYLMIDPQGRFYQNKFGLSGYQYSDNINKVGAARALEQISFNIRTFTDRYKSRDALIIPSKGVSL